MLNNLSGVGALQDALTTTNALLADVLAELRETNGQRLETIATELQALNALTQQLAASSADRPTDR